MAKHQPNFSPEQIRFHLHLGRPTTIFSPPLDITIDGAVGLAVVQGALVSVDPVVTADASLPWYVWLNPVVGAILSIAVSGAGDEAKQGGMKLANELGEFLNFEVISAEAGMGLANLTPQGVDIEPAADGIGSIVAKCCPMP